MCAQLFLAYSRSSREVQESAAAAAKAQVQQQQQWHQRQNQRQQSRSKLPSWAQPQTGSSGSQDWVEWQLSKNRRASPSSPNASLNRRMGGRSTSPDSFKRAGARSASPNASFKRMGESTKARASPGPGQADCVGGDSGDGTLGWGSFSSVEGARVTFVEYMQLCEDRGVLPHCVSPSILEQIFRRVYFMDGDFTHGMLGMGYAQFCDALALTALTVYNSPEATTSALPRLAAPSSAFGGVGGASGFAENKLQHAHQQQAPPESMLEAFFSHVCGCRPQVAVASHQMGGTPGGDAPHMVRAKPDHDPYRKWWELAGPGGCNFKPQEESSAVSHLSSQHYRPTLIQDLVVPPRSCPPEVTVLLAQAMAAHNAGQWLAAVQAYEEAGKCWAESLRHDATQQLSLPELSWMEENSSGRSSPLGFATHNASAGGNGVTEESVSLQRGLGSSGGGKGAGVEGWGWAGVEGEAGAANAASSWHLPSQQLQRGSMRGSEGSVPVLLGGHRIQQLGLSPDKRIFLAISCASVHLSCHQPEAALALYDELAPCLARLPPNHPNAALVLSCRGYALYAMGCLPEAFELLVQALVIRETIPELGVSHVDTALTAHNLGCVLDQLGKSHKALELVGGALKVFQAALGAHHPRTSAASRNLHHIRHSAVHLDMRYRVPRLQPSTSIFDERLLPTGKFSFEHGKGAGGNKAVNLLAHPSTQAAHQLAADAQIAATTGTLQSKPASSGPFLSPQERLAAFQIRRGPSRAAASTRNKKQQRLSRPCDLDYLGGGLRSATPDQMALWQAMRPAVEAHARGDVLKDLPDGVIVVNRLPPPRSPTPRSRRSASLHNATAARPGSSAASMAASTVTTAAQQQQVSAPPPVPWLHAPQQQPGHSSSRSLAGDTTRDSPRTPSRSPSSDPSTHITGTDAVAVADLVNPTHGSAADRHPHAVPSWDAEMARQPPFASPAASLTAPLQLPPDQQLLSAPPAAAATQPPSHTPRPLSQFAANARASRGSLFSNTPSPEPLNQHHHHHHQSHAASIAHLTPAASTGPLTARSSLHQQPTHASVNGSLLHASGAAAPTSSQPGTTPSSALPSRSSSHLLQGHPQSLTDSLHRAGSPHTTTTAWHTEVPPLPWPLPTNSPTTAAPPGTASAFAGAAAEGGQLALRTPLSAAVPPSPPSTSPSGDLSAARASDAPSVPPAAAAAAGGETSFAPAVTPFLASSQSPALSPPTTPPADSLTSSTANQAPVSAHPADTLPPHNNAGLPTRPSTKAPSLRFSITSLPTSPSTDLFTYPSTSLPPPPSSTATTAPARTPNSARLPPPWPHVVVQRRPLSVHDDASIAPRPIDPKLANLLMQQAQLAGVSLPFPPAQSNRSPGRMDTRRKKKDEQPPTIDRLGDLLAPRKKDKKLGSSALAVMRARRRSASKHASKQGTDQSRQVHSSGVQESSVNADSEEESEEEEVDV